MNPTVKAQQVINRLAERSIMASRQPVQVITSYVAGLIFSPEAIRAKSAGWYRVDPVVEIKGALKRIRAITRATRWSREDIEALSNKDAHWEAFGAVFAAEHALEKALPIFRSQTTRLPRGRTGALDVQAVARAMATAWRVLTGRLPAQNNGNFHNLLAAGVATISGHAAKEPNLESATRIAVTRIKKDAASRS